MAFVVTKPVTIAGVTHEIGEYIDHLDAEVLADVAHALVPVAERVKAVETAVRSEESKFVADAIAYEKEVAADISSAVTDVKDSLRSFGRLAPPVKETPSAATDVQEN